MIVFLAFFKPPKDVLKVSGVTLRRATSEEVKQFMHAAEPYIRRLGGTELFGPIGQRGPVKVRLKYTILETNDDRIPPVCYFALLDILKKTWMYVLRREEYYRKYALKLTATHVKHPKVPIYNFNPPLISKLEKGIQLLSKQRRFAISLERWYSSCTRSDPLDTALDCCSSLEAAISLPNELRLRIAFSVYHTMQTNKEKAFALAYEMYGVRNSFIHGDKTPIVSRRQQQSYIKIVADMLYRFIVLGKIPNVEMINRMILKDYT